MRHGCCRVGTAHVPRVRTAFCTLSLRTFDRLDCAANARCRGGSKGGPTGPGPPPPHWRRVHYACAATARSVSKQRRLTAWLNTREGEPPAKHGRQDTENDTEAVSNSSGTLDSTLLSSSSDASALRSRGRTPPSRTHPPAGRKPASSGPPLNFFLDPPLRCI